MGRFLRQFIVLVAIFVTIKLFVQPHWPSLGGFPGYVVAVSVGCALVMGWGYGSNSFSIKFALAFGIFAAATLLVSVYLGIFVGALFCAVMFYLAQKTRFFESRSL